MPNENPVATNPITRPGGRPVSAMPVQRGNYGIPPRQNSAPMPTVAPQPTQVATPMQQPVGIPKPMANGPRMMDIAPPRPIRPAAPAPQAAAQQAPAAAPPLAAVRPFAQPQIANVTPKKSALSIAPKLQLALLIVGALVLIGGVIRLSTAGTTAGHLIAVGAVSANDSKTMTIQFTADDGKLHKFKTDSTAELIPGTAVELAYRSGAADNTVKQVAVVKSERSFGSLLIAAGGVILIAGSIMTLVRHSKTHPKVPRTTLATAGPVTA